MKSAITALLSSLFAILITVAPAFTADTAGIWMASVSINKVGEVNRKVTDSIFALGVSAVQPERPLIAKEGTWAYYDGGDLAPNWQQTGLFSSWSTGRAPLGYTQNSNGIYQAPTGGTQLAFGSDPINKNLTVYFHTTFSVNDKAGLASLRLRGWFYDAVKIYMNGTAIDTGTMGHLVPEGGYRELSIPPANFTDGENSIAVEISAADPAHTELVFDMQLDAMPNEPLVLVSTKSANWKYDDTEKTAAPPNWNMSSFVDSGWKNGAAPLGFGRLPGQIATTVNNAGTVYYRKTISVSNAARYSSLDLSLLRDDGAVVYLNGREIMRSNMPGGTVSFNTSPAEIIGSIDGERYVRATQQLSSGDLLEGDNILAVEIHQHPNEGASATSTPGEVSPTGTAFPLRILLHDDGKGSVRLLKEAVAMTDPVTNKVVALADSSLASAFNGVVFRGETMVGLRTSAIGYDFKGSTRDCTGTLSNNGLVSCDFTLLSGDPTNPFLHRFHPDHDNLDESFTKTTVEAFDIARKFKLTFSTRYPADPNEPERSEASKPPGWGVTDMGGTYSETITGLHKETLSVSGWFTIKRIAAVADLRR